MKKDCTLTFIGGPLNGVTGAAMLARALELEPERAKRFGVAAGNLLIGVYSKEGSNVAIFEEEPPGDLAYLVTPEVVQRIKESIEKDI